MTKEEVVQMIKDVGKSIIANAETIAGDAKYQTGIHIWFDYDFGDTECPEVRYESGFIPDMVVDRLKRRHAMQKK